MKAKQWPSAIKNMNIFDKTDAAECRKGNLLLYIPAKVFIAFLVLSLLIYCNINAVVAMVTNSGQVASLLIGICALYLCCYYRRTLMSCCTVNTGGAWFIWYFIYYISVGAMLNIFSHYASIEMAAQRVFSVSASILVTMAYAVTAHEVYKKRTLTKVILSIFLISSLASVSAIFEWLYPKWGSIFQFKEEAGGRGLGFFANPNEYGTQCLFTVAFGTTLAVLRKNVGWFILATSVGLIGIVLSGSKSCLLLLLIQLPVASIILSRNISKLKALLVATVGVVLTLGLIAMIHTAASGALHLRLKPEFESRFQHLDQILFQGDFDSETTSGRSDLAPYCINMWLESPLLGHGAGTMSPMPGVGHGPHNTFLLVIAETGLLGFTIFAIGWCVFCWQIAWTSGPVRAFLVLSLFGLLAEALSSHNWLEHRNQNAVMGLCIGMLAANKQRKRCTTSPGPNQRMVKTLNIMGRAEVFYRHQRKSQ